MWNLFFGDDEDSSSDQETAVTKPVPGIETTGDMSGLKSTKISSVEESNHPPSHQSTGFDTNSLHSRLLGVTH